MPYSNTVHKLNRKLSKEGLKVKVCRTDSRWFNDLGRYYVIDTYLNTVTAHSIDPIEWLSEIS